MTPLYIIEEEKLRRNLSLIANVARRADVEIILAFKAFALWKTFPIFREYIHATTASSLAEARLAVEKFGAPAHTYSPAYTDDEIDEIAQCSSHLTFNSLSQYERYHNRVKSHLSPLTSHPSPLTSHLSPLTSHPSLGIRINPEYSEVETMLYNPCAPGTRFGITADKLPEQLPEDIDGFHCHCHCESGSDVLQRTLVHIEEKFARWFPQIKWLNLGGGHLMTRKDYDVELLVSLMQGLHQRYPWLKIILEPGSAFAWQTGPLVSHVVDIVEDRGIRTAILDVSFTCHMPDCLEMPYWPEVRGAKTIDHSSLNIDHSSLNIDHSCAANNGQHPMVNGQWSMVNGKWSMVNGQHTYRLGGNSCLSGDFMGFWQFDHELQVGEEVIFEDMIHYTTVKTTMFNGITHPSLAILHSDGQLEMLRSFTYEDYRDRMD